MRSTVRWKTKRIGVVVCGSIQLLRIEIPNIENLLELQNRRCHTRSVLGAGCKALAVVSILVATTRSGWALTSIIAVRTSTSLVLGADSLTTRWDGSEASLGCKIHEAAKVFSAFALVTGAAGTGFDLPRIAADALECKGTLRERIQQVTVGLTVCLEALRRFEVPFFSRRANGNTVSEAVFLGFEDGEPKMLVRWFAARLENGRVHVHRHSLDCPRDCVDGTLAVNLGYHQMQVLPGLWNRDVPAVAERLIERARASHPAQVAGPIAIVQIDHDGVRRLRSGMCRP